MERLSADGVVHEPALKKELLLVVFEPSPSLRDSCLLESPSLETVCLVSLPSDPLWRRPGHVLRPHGRVRAVHFVPCTGATSPWTSHQSHLCLLDTIYAFSLVLVLTMFSDLFVFAYRIQQPKLFFNLPDF